MSSPVPEINPLASGEDRPIVVGGGPRMVTVNLPKAGTEVLETAQDSGQGASFSVVPADPDNKPFKSAVLKQGDKVVFTWKLEGDWTITIR